MNAIISSRQQILGCSNQGTPDTAGLRQHRQMRKACKIFVGMLEWKIPLRRPRRK
jgi:hypothetical protein